MGTRMSLITALLAALLLSCTELLAQGNNFTVIFEESFESKSIPTGWKELKPSGENVKWKYWQSHAYENGKIVPQKPPVGEDKMHEDMPKLAKDGLYYAYFYNESPDFNTLLYTPFINLVGKTKPTLSFYLCMPEFIADVPDLFKVMYRSSEQSEWITLREYQTSTDVWTLEELLLPSERIQIGFFAQTYTADAAGIAIDGIRIEDRTLRPRQLQHTSMWQTSNVLPTGSKTNPVAGIRLLVEGNNKMLNLTKVQFTYNGINLSDIDNFSLYYTKDSLFSPATRIAAQHNSMGSTISFDGLNTELATGKNFVWLCADVNKNSQHGNTVSVKLPAGGITTNPEGASKPTTSPLQEQIHKGVCTIEESLLYTGFEENFDATNWQLTNDWEIGRPTGIGIGDPSIAYSGEQIMATNLDGGYTNNILHSVQSPQVVADYYKNIKLHYARVLNLNDGDKAWITVPEIGDTLYFNTRDGVRDPRWVRLMLPIDKAARQDKISIQMSLESAPQSNFNTPGGWNVDNLAITGNRIERDAGVVSIPTLPLCGLTLAPTTLTVRIRNFGYDDISNFDVGYSFDGGRSYTRKTFNATLKSARNSTNPDDIEKAFSFDPVLITPGYKHIVFRTFLPDDEDEANNAMETKLYAFPTLEGKIDYYTNFGTSHSHWYAQGAGAQQNCWAYGLDTDHNTRGWATGINKAYPDTSISYLESPCYNLSSMEFSVFEFVYSMEVGPNAKLKVQYSQNLGQTWTDIPTSANYQKNWQETGWSTNTTLDTAYTMLPSNLTDVKFRFVFTTSSDIVKNGVLIREVNVKSLPYKVELINDAIVPTAGWDACKGGSHPIEIKLRNTGDRTITAGTRIPLRLIISRPGLSEIIQDTIVTPTDIGKGQIKELQSQKTYNFSVGPMEYSVNAIVSLQPLQVGSKLSSAGTIQVNGNPSFSLGPDKGTRDPSTTPLTSPNIGSGSNTYKWEYYKWAVGDADTITNSTAGWVNKGTAQNLTPAADGYGYYRLTATNATTGCEHVDVVKIVVATQDVQVSSILNLSDECEHPTPIQPTVKVKFVVSDNPQFDGTEFNIGLSLNGVHIASEIFTVPTNWAEGDETEFTFSKTLDLSMPGEYKVSAYTMLNDVDRTNDSTHLTVNTFGAPRFRFGQMVSEGGNSYIPMEYADTIQIPNPMGFELQTTTESPSVSYTWERTTDYAGTQWETRTENGSTLPIPDNLSAHYRVTLTDISTHQCGSTTKQVYVNARDIGIYDMSLPVDTACYSSEGTPIEISIRNMSDDTYPIGTTIEAEAETPAGSQFQTITLTEELLPGGSLTVRFPNNIYLNVNERTNVTARIAMKDDVNALNDSYGKGVQVVPYPTVQMPTDTLFMAFTPETSYDIIPSVSDNVRSYAWTSNGAPIYDANNSNNNATFKIQGLPEHMYKLTVSNGFCEASDSMVIVSQDISIALLSPVDTCSFRAPSYPVKVRIRNEGSDLPAGISISLRGDASVSSWMGTSTTMLNETVTFNHDFKSDTDTVVTLGTQLRLADADNVTVNLVASANGFSDMLSDNNASQRIAFALGYPTIQIINASSASNILEASHLLEIDSTDMDEFRWYMTSDGLSQYDRWTGPDNKVIGHHASLPIGDSIKEASISIYATHLSNCSATAEVNVKFYSHDLELTQLLEPVAACSMPDASVVRVRVTNKGDYTMPANSEVRLKLKVDTKSRTSGIVSGHTDEFTETHTLDQPLAPGQSYDFTFNRQVNMQMPNIYIITTSVNSDHDRLTNNDQRIDTVEHYEPVVISFSDVEKCQGEVVNIDASTFVDPYVLYADKGIPRYAWSTGASSPSIKLRSDKGIYEPDEILYSVEITSGVGCKGNAQATLRFRPLPVAQIVDEDSNPLGDLVEICEGDKKYLGSGIANGYSWNNGKTTAYIYVTNDSTYSVTVTDGMCSNSDSTRVVVHALPHIGMGGPRAICDGNPTTLDAGEAQSYQWILPGGSIADTRTVTAATAGDYIAHIVNMHGCRNTDTVSLTVQPSPREVKINTNNADMTICPTSTAQLTASSTSSNVSYSWSNGQSGQKIEVNQAQQYTVTATNSYGCASSSSIEVLHYEPTPANVITICQGNNYKLKASNPDVRAYQWSPGGNTTNEIDAELGRTYSLTITDSHNCQFTEQVTASIPQVHISLAGNSCEGSTVKLSSNLPNAQHKWSTGQNTPSIDVTKSGKYMLEVTTDGCITQDEFTLTMHPAPTPNIKVSGNKLVVEGGPYSSYSWGNGETTPEIAFGGAGQYSVTVTNAHGCSGTAQFTYTSLGSVGTLAANVTAYPNPASQQLNVRISTDQHEIYTLTLYSALGAAQWQRTVQVDGVHIEPISVEHLPAGIYLLHVSSGERASTIRVVVE